MKRFFIRIAMIFFLVSGYVFASETVYVKSLKADLKSGPAFSSKTSITLNRGSKLAVIKKKGMWLKVKKGAKAGWILKMSVGDRKPTSQITLTAGAESKGSNKMIRRRASSYQTAASARGLVATRSRGGKATIRSDFESVEKIEKIRISEKALKSFIAGL